MDEKWLEIIIRTPSEAAEIVGSELAELGCEGITVEERRLDTFVPPDPDEAPAEYLLRAYFMEDDPEALCVRVRERLEAFSASFKTQVLEVRPVGEEDWAQGWKQHFSAVRFGRLVVKPSWEDVPLCGEDAVVNLDPGMAFGTGTHATTRLCLEALAGFFATPEPPRRILDVGTGSGILAIAGAALGAERVLACDIEEEACRTARENAERNGVGEIVEVTAAPLGELEGGFDAVLANILAEENARLAHELSERLAPGGALILSGILREKEALVTEAFAALPLAGPEIRRQEEWSCLIYRKLGKK